MRAHRQIAGSLAALIAMHAAAQMPYPELTIQDAAWTDGTHQYAVSNRILSPGAPHLPVDISGTADAEFVSAASVRLRPGFHAGGFAVNQGRFRARIDEGLGQPADLVIISPAPDGSSPYGSIEDNVVHVHKWEKVELGLRLPAIYQAAIDSFFHHYYPHPNDPYLSAPGNTDPVHDLNPYADDSLQLVMTLTRPDGSSTMRWGFFTREATWDSTVSDPDMAWLIEGTGSPLQPYAVRFRFAPDQEGAWSFRISAKAPLTSDAQGATLPELLHTGFGLQCMPPLADNNGYLQVNAANRRHLQFQGDPALQGDETPFFGLGTNMANINHGSFGAGVVPPGVTYIKRDHRNFQETMERLHAVGGNYLRMYLLEKIFSPEYVNLGVYDQYRSQPACANGNAPSFRGNCQYQCWAFDQMIDCARANNIYLQVCVDAYPPGINFESLGWGANAYWLAFIEPNPLPPPQRFNMRKFFYTYGEGHPDRYTKGVFYYWKRKYKYMMSRWGWSVNIAALEPFNEIDQLLTYRTDTIDGNCNENDGAWAADAQLPDTISAWFGDMARFVRGTQDPEHPARSPLGENKLFLASYAMNDPGMPAAESFYAPLTNPEVDLIDAHLGLYPDLQAERDLTDERIHQGIRNATAFWNRFPAAQSDWQERKPFNQGEYNHYTQFTIPNPNFPNLVLWRNDVEKIFHNYDVSFHNELWSSAFSGKFAAGTTWHWERVFWWEDAMPLPPEDDLNNEQIGLFTNHYPGTNNLDLGLGIPIPIANRPIHHHFQAIADFLNRPSIQDLGIFSGAFTPNEFFDDDDSDGINPLEAYYLRSDQSTAIGWVHNRNASVAKSFYVMSGAGNENFLGCTAPDSASITLSGFFPLHSHYITWFPTRIGATDLPQDSEFPSTLQSDANGDIVINLDGEFNGVDNNYLDTLHADYAFVITPGPFVKSLAQDAVETETDTDWDFSLYPNPTRDLLTLSFADDTNKDVALLDVSGRIVARHQNIVTLMLQIPIGPLAKGAYWVHVTSGDNMKVKKMIIR
ncbi:MAG: T9SS type A sorting domain-containing protein [Flavobacteriales bacterium]|nr:MAG: T9SS type A sorting domain-containing protein [Flavobacteriales bacterium]